MPGNTCEYITCKKRKSEYCELKMYRFPVKDIGRLMQWKINSGNASLLDLNEEKLKRRYICERHFTPESFVNATRHRLTCSAVPIPYNIAEKDKDTSFTSEYTASTKIKIQQEDFEKLKPTFSPHEITPSSSLKSEIIENGTVPRLTISEKIEQRICIKFCVKLGKSAPETLEMLRQAFDDKAFCHTQCVQWHARFKGGQMSIQDIECSGQPRTNITPEIADKIRQIVFENRRQTTHEISEILGISYEACHAILTDDHEIKEQLKVKKNK